MCDDYTSIIFIYRDITRWCVFVPIPEDIDTLSHVSQQRMGVLVETRRFLAIKVHSLQITHTHIYTYTMDIYMHTRREADFLTMLTDKLSPGVFL